MSYWIFVPPFLLLAMVLGFCVPLALRSELRARAGRHRGVYEPLPAWREKIASGLAGAKPALPNQPVYHPVNITPGTGVVTLELSA